MAYKYSLICLQDIPSPFKVSLIDIKYVSIVILDLFTDINLKCK